MNSAAPFGPFALRKSSLHSMAHLAYFSRVSTSMIASWIPSTLSSFNSIHIFGRIPVKCKSSCGYYHGDLIFSCSKFSSKAYRIRYNHIRFEFLYLFLQKAIHSGYYSQIHNGHLYRRHRIGTVFNIFWHFRQIGITGYKFSSRTLNLFLKLFCLFVFSIASISVTLSRNLFSSKTYS